MKYKCEMCQSEFGNSYNFKRHSSYCNGKGKRSDRPKRTVSEGLKLKWQDPEYAAKISSAMKKIGWQTYNANKELVSKTRSEEMKKRYSEGWQPTCGRSKKYKHESPIAGIISVDGTWELKVAQYLDEIGVQWERNYIRFDYLTPSGKLSTYCPDFYVKDWEAYLEVKGYETELDKAKWSQFLEKLIIWRKEDLYKMKILGR